MAVKKKHDPAAMFMIADQYRNAADCLARAARDDHPHDIRVPAVVCSAFALEIFLKCLLTTETGKTPQGHNLRQLFNALNKPTQKRIRDLFVPFLPRTQLHLTEIARVGGGTVPNVDFDYILEMSKNAFELMRYIYEGIPSQTGWIAGGIVDATRQAILEQNPTWDELVMDLQILIDD